MTPDTPELKGMKPRVIVHADNMLPAFKEAAKVLRRKATWYFSKETGAPRIVLYHEGEEPMELSGGGVADKAKIMTFLRDNAMPLFGKMDGDSFDTYIETGKGIVWSLFPHDGPEGFAGIE